MSDQIFVAKESFATTLDGESVVVQKGVTRVRAGHKLLKNREMFFEPLTVHYDVERATAAPAEVRESKPQPAPTLVARPTPVTAKPAAKEDK